MDIFFGRGPTYPPVVVTSLNTGKPYPVRQEELRVTPVKMMISVNSMIDIMS
jgi:hypothetical protein